MSEQVHAEVQRLSHQVDGMVLALAVTLPEPAGPAATQSDDAYPEPGAAEISVVHKDLCMSPFDSGRNERAEPQNVIPAKQAVSKRLLLRGTDPRNRHSRETGCVKTLTAARHRPPKSSFPRKRESRGGLGRGFLTIPRRRVVCHNPSRGQSTTPDTGRRRGGRA